MSDLGKIAGIMYSKLCITCTALDTQCLRIKIQDNPTTRRNYKTYGRKTHIIIVLKP